MGSQSKGHSPDDSSSDDPASSGPASWREQQIFREGPVTVFRWVAAEGWPVEYVTPNVRQFGYAADEFTSGRVPYASIVHPDDLARVAAEVAAHSASGVTSFEQDYRVIRRDGQAREIFDRTVVIRDATGTITHYDGYIIDVTERRRSETERRELELQVHAAQKLESLGVLAGGIAHDFNNLLQAMLGNASLALAQMRADDPSRAAIESIERAAKRATELTNEMLAYSGRGRFHVEPIDLSRLVADTAQLLHTIISKKATLTLELDPRLPPIEGDASQLRQVVMNLLTNASDALGEKPGSLLIRTSVGRAPPPAANNPLPREPLPRAPCVVLEVEDDGCGMDGPTCQRIFEPFFTTKQTGTGLGLSSTLGIVRGHGAAILVASRPGLGTTMHVRFPVSLRAPAAGTRPPVVENPGARRTGLILLVDDEAQVLDVARRMLERLGHRVVITARAAEALCKFKEMTEPFLAAIVDLTLPDESGDLVITQLRALRPDLPVLLSSGYDEQDTRPRLATTESFGFLRKPYTLAELDAALRTVLPGPGT